MAGNCSSLSLEQKNVILLAYSSVGAVSVALCFCGILCVFWKRLYTQSLYRLASYQVASALLFGLARSLQVFSINRNDDTEVFRRMCEAVAFLTVCSSWIKLLFTAWLTLHLFVYATCLKNLNKLELLYILSSIIIGPLVAVVPFLTNAYGRSGPWCWIENHHNTNDSSCKYLKGEIEQFAVWYGPAFVFLLLISIFVLITLIVFVCRAYCHSNSIATSPATPLLHDDANRKHKKALKLVLPLLIYPLIFCVLIVVPMVNRLYQFLTEKTNFGLFLASAVSIPGMSCAAGLAIIVHIMSLHCPNYCSSKGHVDRQQENMGDVSKNKPQPTRASTTCTVLPNESDLED